MFFCLDVDLPFLPCLFDNTRHLFIMFQLGRIGERAASLDGMFLSRPGECNRIDLFLHSLAQQKN